MSRNWQIVVVALVVALLGSLGCSSKHKLVAGAPDWVNQGSGAFDDDGSRVFYGVGAVAGISSQTLAVQAADQRARGDIARQLETLVSGLSRDYQSATSAQGAKPGTEEQQLEQSLKTVTEVSVRGSRIVDHWKDPETNTVYSLVKLDLDSFKAAISQLDAVDPAKRGFMSENAEKTFDQLKEGAKK